MHTHSFIEVAFVISGGGVHHSVDGRRRLQTGDAVLLRPGVWHGYEDCDDLLLYNLCFSAELLRRELNWTRDDPLLGHLLWTGPYVEKRRGILATRLSAGDHEALKELAELLHLAPGYVVRLFKSVTGLPPMAYLSRYRVELAAEMLLHSDRPVRAIAEQVGWPDANYFARRFRAHYGLTASEYRARFTPRYQLGRPVIG
ncbi:AraC family transcriptional regulator [Actinoplanes sp. CA-131856]